MSQQPYKLCPQCGQPAALNMEKCGRCGHAYRTAFVPTNQTQMVVPPPSGYQPPPDQYGQYPQQYNMYPQAQQDVTGFIVGAIGLSILSLFVMPIFSGAGAVFCAYKVKSGGKESLGIALMVMGFLCAVIGIIFRIIMAMQMLSHLPKFR